MKIMGVTIAMILFLVILVGLVFIFRFLIGESEDSWIKDEKGVYIKHGVPSSTPDYVQEQQQAVICALQFYQQKKAEGMNFSSQCLGVCGNYAVDIVHVPKSEEDDKPENQCKEYREGEASKFIELDKEGNIFRIV